jgi:hypothetical protein
MQSGANRSWAKESPYERFFDFIAPDADRFGILSEHTKKLGLNSVVISIEGNRHFFIFPRGKIVKPSAGGTLPFRGQKPVVLTAHYDRVPGSPGANDNSAAVFQLLKTALRLGEQGIDNWIIIFTDKEELQNGEGISVQGSFSLAKKLKSSGFANARIFNFDACGTGNTFVFSNTVNYLINKNKRPEFRRTNQIISRLREKALNTARFLHFSKTLLVPVPFSDDAGFLQGGIPAQTITMLPADEAKKFALMFQEYPGLADMIIAGTVKDSDIHQILPETWRCLNSPLDDHLRLTPEYFDRIVRFAVELCQGD